MRRFALSGVVVLLLVASLSGGCPVTPVEITVETLPNAVQGDAYTADLTVTGGSSAAWSIVDGALPAGLGLGRSTGTIQGTPAEAGTAQFLVRATRGGVSVASDEAWFTLTVIPKLEVSAALEVARVAGAYSDGPTIVGGVPPYLVTVAGLPAGLQANPQTGQITGTPVIANDDLLLLIDVVDSGDPQQSESLQTTLIVKPEGVAISNTTLPDAALGQAYSATVNAAKGRPPYTWSISSSVLPDDLHLNRSSGVIAGTIASDARTRVFTVTVVDSDSPPSSASRAFRIVVPVAISTTNLPAATAGSAYSATVVAAGGLPPLTWSLTGTLPAGLTLNAATGVISGVVDAGATTETLTLRVEDADAPPTLADVTLELVVN